MVLVVCPNLAIDYTLRVDELRPGDVHRAQSFERQAGARGSMRQGLFAPLGQEAVICGFVGGDSGRFIERGLTEENLRRELVPIGSESRTCVIVLSTNGEPTVVNESGPTVTESDTLMSLVAGLIPESDAVAMMGSLPPGMPSHSYAQLTKRCRDAEVPCLVDTSGPALTLGNEGAVLCASALEGRLRAQAVTPVNPTGAGDALAAGLIAGHLKGGSLRSLATN